MTDGNEEDNKRTFERAMIIEEGGCERSTGDR